jgi:ADP-ribose pyrophosphatase
VTWSKGTVLRSKLLYRGPLFSVRRDLVAEPNGVKAYRDVVLHHGSVVLLPVFPSGEILLVRQYRHSVGCFLWELPAGRMEAGESPLAAARRELAEETGYTARRFRQLMDVFPTPGFVSEHMVVFSCHGLAAGEAHPDEDEQIETRPFTLRQLERMMRTGRLRDAKSIASILYFEKFCGR